jgi:hypothetical protein
VVSRPEGVRGFVPIHKRWVVERTFGWLMLNRRCVREYEKRVWSSESRVKVAAVGMMLRGLKCNDGTRGTDCIAMNIIHIMPPLQAA